MGTRAWSLLVLSLVACGGTKGAIIAGADASDASIATDAGAQQTHDASEPDAMTNTQPHFPLSLVADVALPGNPVRFDYQDVDVSADLHVIAHMSDSSVIVLRLSDTTIAKVFTGIPVARGVVIAGDAHRIFATSSPATLVV